MRAAVVPPALRGLSACIVRELYKPRTVWPWLRMLGLAYAWLIVFGIFLIAWTMTGDLLLILADVPRVIGYPVSLASIVLFVSLRRRRGL